LTSKIKGIIIDNYDRDHDINLRAS
jgi:hypothetical protein